MAEQYDIKARFEREGDVTIQQICEETGHCYRTVKKIVDRDDWNEEVCAKKEKARPVIGPYEALIDGMLEEDRKAPRKQRRTAKRIYTILMEEHGFEGSYSAVKKYVRARKQETGHPSDPGYMPLNHVPGSAQMDFGEQECMEGDGRIAKCYHAVLSFPYSNKGYFQVYPAQNQECLFESLRRIFEHIGGVPQVIRFDNMSTAVASVLKGKDRKLTDGFRRFALHYGFKAEFCAPASPESKGHVENKVGYIRRNVLTPVPTIEDFAAFNEAMFDWCEKDGEREHYSRKRSINDLWEEDKAALRPLPEVPYDGFRLKSMRVNKCGFVTFETNKYGLDPALGGCIVEAKVRADCIEFFHNNKQVGTYRRCYEKSQMIGSPESYLGLMVRKPNAATECRFFNDLPANWREHIANAEGSERRDALTILLEASRIGTLDQCAEALDLAAKVGRKDSDTILQCMYSIAKSEERPKPLKLENDTVELADVPDLSAYDRLTGGSQ